MEHFQVGDRLELEFTDQGTKRFTSEIIKMAGEEFFVAATPELRPAPVNLNSDLKVRVFRTDGLYQFNSKVTYRGYAYFSIALPPKIDYTQRRSDFRIPVKLPVDILYFYRNGIPVTALTVNSIDLSAGGIKILTPEKYETNKEFKISLFLPGEIEIQLRVKTIHSGEMNNHLAGTDAKYWTAFKFLEIPEGKKKKILKFVYQQQELHVKSLI